MKKTISLLLFVAFSFLITAFSSGPTQNDWKLYKEIDGIKIYTKTSACILQHTNFKNLYLLFKYENSTNKDLRISGRVEPYYNNTCRSCGLDSPNEYDFSIDIPAGESREGNCSDEMKAFKLFKSSDNTNIAPLDKFIFSNLSVREIK
jgi:hypothetical protein